MASAGKCTASHKWRAAARAAAGCELALWEAALSSCGSELARDACRASPSCTSTRARVPRLAVPERITHPPGPTALALQYLDIQPTCRARV